MPTYLRLLIPACVVSFLGAAWIITKGFWYPWDSTVTGGALSAAFIVGLLPLSLLALQARRRRAELRHTEITVYFLGLLYPVFTAASAIISSFAVLPLFEIAGVQTTDSLLFRIAVYLPGFLVLNEFVIALKFKTKNEK